MHGMKFQGKYSSYNKEAFDEREEGRGSYWYEYNCGKGQGNKLLGCILPSSTTIWVVVYACMQCLVGMPES